MERRLHPPLDNETKIQPPKSSNRSLASPKRVMAFPSVKSVLNKRPCRFSFLSRHFSSDLASFRLFRALPRMQAIHMLCDQPHLSTAKLGNSSLHRKGGKLRPKLPTTRNVWPSGNIHEPWVQPLSGPYDNWWDVVRCIALWWRKKSKKCDIGFL